MLQGGRSLVRASIKLCICRSASNRAMALGSTQHLTTMSTTNLPTGKRRPAREADDLTAVSRLSRENVGASTSDKPMGLHGLLLG
jgi:hypothetical protein